MLFNIVKKTMKGPVKVFFWSIKNSCEVLNKLNFGDFRCGALLFMVIHVIYKYKNKLNVRLAGDYLFGQLLFTWLSLVVSMVMSFCAVLFPTRCLG